VAQHHGHSTTIQRKSKENPADRVCDRRYPVSRGVTYGLSRLRPAAPTVDRATIWPDEVNAGRCCAKCAGWDAGTEDIRWIPAQTDSRVDRWVLRPGAIVKANSVIMELSDPTLQRDALDAEFQLKGAEAEYANLQVQVNSELMNRKRTKPPCAVITSRPTCNMT